MDTTVLDGQWENPSQKKKESREHTIAAGVAGAILGAGGVVIIGELTDKAYAGEVPASDDIISGGELVAETPAWAIGDIAVAQGVSDDMSFREAFAAARAEVGPGGAFEWHGGVYGTYTASEWNHMSGAEKADFNNHFSWSHLDSSTSNVATKEHHHHHHHHPDNHITFDVVNEGHEAREIVDVVEPVDEVEYAYDPPQEHSMIEIVDVEPEIEILGVVHDDETGANIGGLLIDDQEVYLVDVEGDLIFDIAASDLDGSGTIDKNEVMDIRDQGLTVEDLGGFSNPYDDNLASDDFMGGDDLGQPV